MNVEDTALAAKCGLEASMKVFNINPALFASLKPLLVSTGVAERGCETRTGNLLLYVVTNLPADKQAKREYLAEFVAAGRLVTQTQVAAAVAFLKKAPEDVPAADFAAACGLDVHIEDADITERVRFYRWCTGTHCTLSAMKLLALLSLSGAVV